MTKQKQFEELTRGVFHELHKGQADDEGIYDRLTSLLTTDYLQVDKDFLKTRCVWMPGVGQMLMPHTQC